MNIPVWSIPLAVSVMVILIATFIYQTSKSRGDYAGFGNSVLFLFYGGLAAILSLLAWLIYFIIV